MRDSVTYAMNQGHVSTKRHTRLHTHTHTHTHTDPTILPRVQVDKGAIRFILSGANIMCPGLTSPGARMDVSLPQDTVVVSSYIPHTLPNRHII